MAANTSQGVPVLADQAAAEKLDNRMTRRKKSHSTLADILEHLPKFEHPDLLAGCGVPDGARVYRLRPDLALVQTVGFFTPVWTTPTLLDRRLPPMP